MKYDFVIVHLTPDHATGQKGRLCIQVSLMKRYRYVSALDQEHTLCFEIVPIGNWHMTSDCRIAGVKSISVSEYYTFLTTGEMLFMANNLMSYPKQDNFKQYL